MNVLMLVKNLNDQVRRLIKCLRELVFFMVILSIVKNILCRFHLRKSGSLSWFDPFNLDHELSLLITIVFEKFLYVTK